MVELTVLIMISTMVQCMTGTGVLIMVGTEALSMADTAVNRQFEDHSMKNDRKLSAWFCAPSLV